MVDSMWAPCDPIGQLHAEFRLNVEDKQGLLQLLHLNHKVRMNNVMLTSPNTSPNNENLIQVMNFDRTFYQVLFLVEVLKI